MTRAAPIIAIFVAAMFLTGCNRPLHSGMPFGEIRTAVRSEVAAGMEYQEIIFGLEKLRLSPELALAQQNEAKPDIVAFVPPNGFANPFDWTRSSYGHLRVYLDNEDKLATVMYAAPYRERKQSGGWWSDDPVLLIGATP